MFRVCQKDDPNSPWPIFERLLKSHDELAELDAMMDMEITVAFMLRDGDWKGMGGAVSYLGKCYCGPSAQGDLRPLFEQLLTDTLGYYPDFLIVLSGDFWETATGSAREVLVFHEALHAGHARDREGELRFNRIDGKPITAIRPHDLEEFNAVVERYGAWKPDVEAFLKAARAHGVS